MNNLKSIVFLLNICFSITAFSQNYTVARIKGQITNQTTQQLLKRGSDYQKADKLQFSHSSNRIAVFDKTGQLYIVAPTKARSRSAIPSYRRIQARIKGRDGEIMNEIDLINHIGEEKSYLIAGSRTKIKLSTAAFPMNQDTFFYIRYTYDEDTINKVLAYEGNQLIIDKTTLFTAKYEAHEKYGVDTTIQINPVAIKAFEFRYYDYKNQQPIYIRDRRLADDLQMRIFIPIRLKFLNTKILKEELDFVIPSIKKNEPNKSSKALSSQIHAYLEEQFEGALKAKNLKEWLKVNYPNWH